jgi:arginyl-tRNA synthetase
MEAYLLDQLAAALREMGVPDDFTPELETPANADHGDVATSAPLKLARELRRAPRQIADELAGLLRERLDPRRVASVEVAGPGFLNLRYSDAYLSDALAEVIAAGETWGHTQTHAGETALVEFVSANPTGPLTVGHGRNAVLGDVISSLLGAVGYDVTREYYFNDAGRQMRVLGQSVAARYRSLVDPSRPTQTIEVAPGETVEVPADFPDGGYLGGYIQEIAQSLVDEQGDALMDAGDEAPFKQAAQTAIFADITQTLGRMQVHMDTHFNEHTLYTDGQVDQVVERLRAHGMVAERDGATWFLTSTLPDPKLGPDGEPADTVLVKSTGEPTYRLPDIAYHIDKLDRGFSLAVDVFGADHIATYPDVISALDVLGYDTSRVDVVIYQFVTLVRGGQPVKMSTRKANYVTLDELMDDVGADVTRFFFLMRAPGTHLEFDLDLAKEASDKNPVFYLQYAHARVCSILRKAGEQGLSTGDADLSLLSGEAETGLIKELLRMPEVVARAAEGRAPHLLPVYLREVAVAFTRFYDACRILGEPEEIATARLALADAARQTLANGLGLLGLTAPDRM